MYTHARKTTDGRARGMRPGGCEEEGLRAGMVRVSGREWMERDKEEQEGLSATGCGLRLAREKILKLSSD